MLDLDSYKEKVDLANDDILEVISVQNRNRKFSLSRYGDYLQVRYWTLQDSLALVVFKLDVKAIFNAYFHFDRIIAVRRHAVRVNPDVLFFGHVGHAPPEQNAKKVTKLHIDPIVRFIRLFDILEVKVEHSSGSSGGYLAR